MTSHLEKILVPLDGSELSDRILGQVRRILLRQDARVMLVRVVPAAALAQEKVPGSLVSEARQHLDRIKSGLDKEGATVEVGVLVGEPAERIHLFSAEWRPSLIALATHGRTGLARWVRGSTAERILRLSSFPLLLANPFGLKDKGEARFRRILVPLDGSERSAEILPLVAEVARLYEAEVVLQLVIEVPAVEYPMTTLIMTEAEGMKLLEGFAPRLEGIKTRLRATVGQPAIAILDAADSEKVDLLALTTHGRSGVSRWAFGSVAEHVVRHAPCPLLVKRTVNPGPA